MNMNRKAKQVKNCMDSGAKKG